MAELASNFIMFFYCVSSILKWLQIYEYLSPESLYYPHQNSLSITEIQTWDFKLACIFPVVSNSTFLIQISFIIFLDLCSVTHIYTIICTSKYQAIPDIKRHFHRHVYRHLILYSLSVDLDLDRLKVALRDLIQGSLLFPGRYRSRHAETDALGFDLQLSDVSDFDEDRSLKG